MYIIPSTAGPSAYQQSRNHFTPQTPSPLRTSRNANLMSPPKWTASSPLDTKSSPLAPYASSQQKIHIEPQHHRRASTPPAFPTASPFSTSTTNTNTNTWSNFASRSRASTPQATLSAQNATAKDRRKTLFRDKIRKQRDDARFEGRGDQVLRMDFVRERREWEARLARRAPAQIAQPDEDDEEGQDEEMAEGGEIQAVNAGAEEAGIEPPIEEDEIDALAQYLVDREDEALHPREEARTEKSWHQQHGQMPFLATHPDSVHSGGGGSYGSDEEDYDQLFMEVVSASQEQEQNGLTPDPAPQLYLYQETPCLDTHHCDHPTSSMMDLS